MRDGQGGLRTVSNPLAASRNDKLSFATTSVTNCYCPLPVMVVELVQGM